MEYHHPIRELPVDLIDEDPKSPHHGFGTPEENDQLRRSIQRFGVMSALIVCEDGHGRYLVIDGLRRRRIARELGLKKLWCVVHPPMDAGDRELLRFQLEASFKPLTQAEQDRERRRLRKLGVELDV